MPVSFCLVAVVLIVFGVAYYIQNRNRFTIETADFNFGETTSVDMEYKTFQQRLMDSICDKLIRNHDNGSFTDEQENTGGGESSIRYGSMTWKVSNYYIKISYLAIFKGKRLLSHVKSLLGQFFILTGTHSIQNLLNLFVSVSKKIISSKIKALKFLVKKGYLEKYTLWKVVNLLNKQSIQAF